MNALQPLFPGELSALTAALFWAVASVFFADIGKHMHAVHLNLIKGVAAILLMSAVLGVGSLLHIDTIGLQTICNISGYGWFLLILSGGIGIALGDTAYFACLKRIGPQKGLMLESTAPILAALTALWLYAEYLPFRSWAGIVITTLGVILVLRLGSGAPEYRNSLAGILLGVLAAGSQAMGIVLSRMALAGENIEPLAGGLIRLSAGLFFLALWLGNSGLQAAPCRQQGSLRQALRSLRDNRLAGKLAIAIFIGTFLAIWLQQLAVKFTSAGTTQALLGTCPLFGILIAASQGYRQPAGVWLGLLCGLGGICLLFAG